MDFFDGQTITINDVVYTFRNYTNSDLSGLNDFDVYSDYGFEIEVPLVTYRSNRGALRNYFDVNDFVHSCNYPLFGRSNGQWMNWETRRGSIDLYPLLLLPTIIIKWHADLNHIVARNDGIIWIESIDCGSFRTMMELIV